MTWNWQLKGWPNYIYNIKEIEQFELVFLKASGIFLGGFKHLNSSDQEQFKIELLSDEALNTSAIEGEYLNRDSLQVSLKRALGLATASRHVTPAEKGIAQMMLMAYQDYASPLSSYTLFSWHKLLMSDRSDIDNIGAYRTHTEPMLIASGGIRSPTIHFQAPPSEQIPYMMENFIQWFNQSAPEAKKPLPALLRAAITHVYFESIHPFEDGNGRIGRALAEKALSQCQRQPTLIALSTVIEQNKKAYYAALKTTNHSLDISSWLNYFSQTTLAAQAYTQEQIEFLIQKSKFFEKFHSQLNERQRKVLLRMFCEGPHGFKGGLSAENYINITQTSRASATRDLQELLAMCALTKRGELRYTRYFLKLYF